MRWSYRCGKLLGIDVYVHVTFFLLLGYFLLSGLLKTDSMMFALFSVGLVLITFSIVVMHELGHSMAARHFGIATRNIMLLPIGGVASLERMPEKPKEELIVALSGPAVNLVLAALFAGLRYLHSGILFSFDWGHWEAGLIDMLLHWMVVLNMGLLAFNLIPAFPMDGGRVLRALLGFKYDYLRASEIAVKVARVVAVGFFVYALLGRGSMMLMLIAFFVWKGGSDELNMIRQREMMRQMAAQFGGKPVDWRQGVITPNGERIVLVPGAMGWRLVRMSGAAAQPKRGAGADAEALYENITAAHKAENRNDDEPRARIIDVE
ncbi:site-2 protease family protein [bacterium]|nr:site-2 protease family protein [bacterium]